MQQQQYAKLDQETTEEKSFAFVCPIHGPHNGTVIAGRTKSESCPLCVKEKRILSRGQTIAPEKGQASIVIHFPEVELLEQIVALAREKERTPEQQIRYFLKSSMKQQTCKEVMPIGNGCSCSTEEKVVE